MILEPQVVEHTEYVQLPKPYTASAENRNQIIISSQLNPVLTASSHYIRYALISQ